MSPTTPTTVQILCESEHPDLELLFAKVAGIPLLLRNIRTLEQMGVQKIELILPEVIRERFEREIQPALTNHPIKVDLKTYQNNFVQVERPLLTFPAHSLIEIQQGQPHFRVLVDSPAKIKMAELQLAENIRLSALGPVARALNKRISLPISLFLARHRLHPNWVSCFNIIIGYSTGFFVAQGTYLGYLCGGFLFQMASVFDGCDGELAKLTFKTNKLGEYLDSISDNGALISFFLGLVIAFSRQHSLMLTSAVALFLITGLGLLFWQIISFLKKHTHSASLATFDKEYLSKLPLPKNSLLMRFIHYGKIFMRKDVFSLCFFLAAVFGILQCWFYLAVIGIWITNGVLLVLKQKLATIHEKNTEKSYCV